MCRIKIKLKILVFLVAIIAGKYIYATAQVPDYLIYKGDTLPIFSNPLEQYFQKKGNRLLLDFVGCVSTACWRGYKAIWELKNDSLFLRQITSCHQNCGIQTRDANLKLMFGTDRVFAKWFTGKIIVPQGKLVQYVHMGYASIYEKELHLFFRNGINTKEKVISNKKIIRKIEFRERKIAVEKAIQDTLFAWFKTYIDWKTYYFCDEKYILTFNPKGKLVGVQVDQEPQSFGEKIINFWDNITIYRECRKLIRKILKPLDISYLNLPKQKFHVSFEVFFNNKTGELELWKEEWMKD